MSAVTPSDLLTFVSFCLSGNVLYIQQILNHIIVSQQQK